MSRNPFKRLQDLLAPAPLQIGTVLAVDDEIATVEMPGGGTIRARGTAAVADKVFVRGNLIEGIAPSLPIDTVEV